MATLNVERAIAHGRELARKNPGYDLSAGQIMRFFQYDDDWDKICDAFFLGVTQGMKIAKAETII